MVSVQSVGRPGLAPTSIASDFGELSRPFDGLRVDPECESRGRAVASFAWFDKLTTLSLVEGQESLHATTRETLLFEILEESDLLAWLKCQEAHAKPLTR